MVVRDRLRRTNDGVGVRDRVRRRLLRAVQRPDAPARAWSGTGLPPAPQDHGLPADAFIVAPARHQAVFRLLGPRREARVRDFQSNHAKERPRGPDETYADYLGLSVFSSEELAMENAIRWPKHVAALLLPQDEGFSIARTYPEIEGHYTVWGDPDRLLANVERVSTRQQPGTLEQR
jgi:hypothetical protein